MSQLVTGIVNLIVIAKQPRPGRVKTRLIGDRISAADAAELAESALHDTFAALAQLPARHRILLLDGQPGGWLPDGWTVQPQVRGPLDQRLSAGFDGVGRVCSGPSVLVGMDTPQMTAPQLAFDPDRFDACLGMATDGGYWAIGFADPSRARSTIPGVPMSSPRTGAEQLDRLRRAGLSVQMLDTLTDVDDQVSAEQVAAAHPNTRFARHWQALADPARQGALLTSAASVAE